MRNIRIAQIYNDTENFKYVFLKTTFSKLAYKIFKNYLNQSTSSKVFLIT